MKNVVSTFIIILTSFFTNAQENYNNLWLEVERIEISDLPKFANAKVEAIYNKAIRENNNPQIIKCLLYKSKFALILEEDAQLKVINNFKKHINESDFPTKNVLENILANLYWQYFNKNRYKFYQRSKTSSKVDNTDFRTWDLNTLFNEVHIHFNNSLSNENKLQQIAINEFSEILNISNQSKEYHPTLFDFLANNALQFYKTSENSITKPKYAFTLNDESFLSEVTSFTNLKLTTEDKQSLQFNALKIYQKLISFHLKNKTLAALGEADIQRINFVKQFATFDNKNQVTLETLKSSKEYFNTNEVSGIYAFEIAQIYNKQALSYKSAETKKNRFKNKEAITLCENIIEKFPKSLGAEKCQILKNSIEKKSLRIYAEKNIPINKKSRLLIQYKNIDSLHFYAYKVTQKQITKLNSLYKQEERVTYINSLEKVANWNSILRNENDYLRHTTEVIVPELENGSYLILATDNDKLYTNGIFGSTYIQVTNLVLVQNNFNNTNNYQVVDRNTGKAIPNAKIHLKNSVPFNKKMTTDKNGFASFKSKVDYNSISATISTKNDKAIYKNLYVNNHNKTKQPKNETISLVPFIFTDRSIYRPGQTVYFKSIVIKRGIEKTEVFKDEYVSVTLFDVNGQKVKELDLKLNEFGSVSGEFILPNNGLTGQFRIEVSETEKQHKNDFYNTSKYNFQNANQSFSVEEYKRPKFETEFTPVKETYKVNDSVTVKGFAKAFAGSNITDAKVIYRVHRNVRYPSWYYWRRPNTYSSSQEITHGETTTNQKGEFEITFKAIVDESVPKEGLPIFSYEISADVTDINGETRSTSTYVKIGYHSLLATINSSNKIDKNDKKNLVTIDTKNLNGEFVPAKGTIKIYKLQAPKNPQRKRPWAAPDYQDIPEATFRELFPNEAYTDEERDEKNWQKGKQVFNKEFNTEISKEIPLKNTKNWVSGKYIIVLESIDKFGQVVKDEKRVEFFTKKENSVSDSKLFFIKTTKPTYEPNENAILKVGSASKDITAVVQIEKNHEIIKTHLIHLNNEVKTIEIPVSYEDLGGFAIKYHFVNYNYFESGSLLVKVPFKEEKPIELITNVFRDKLQPGQEETWSFKVKNDNNDKFTSEILASMYDASLDEFKSHYWNFNPITPKRTYYSYGQSNAQNSFGNAYFNIKNYYYYNKSYPTISLNSYNWFGFTLNKNRWFNQSYLRKIRHKLQYLKIEKEKELAEKRLLDFDGLISGKITTIEGDPIPGVSIVILNTTRAVCSDFDGNFSINVQKGEVIEFSSVGFETRLLTKKSALKKEIIILSEDSIVLEEVVVVGYGARKKSNITGSVSKVSAEMIQQVPVSRVDDALKGKVAGVSVSDEDDITSVRIRGASSITGDSKPLYVVDGVIVDSFDIDKSEIISLDVLKDAASLAIYGSRGANGVILVTTKKGQAKIDNELSNVKARTNLKETAFFFPQLKTNKKGEVSFSFTAPEALTRWKLQLLAHTQNAKSASKTLQTITQKELMVVPNAPRFLRQGDTIILSAKISNLSNTNLNGFAQLQLTDAITGKEINFNLNNINKNKNFSVDKGGNTNVSWNLNIPYGLESVQYKIVAKAGDFSDGEQNVLPVLTNRMLVTETIPMWVRSNQTKTFSLDKLKNQTSNSIVHHKLTLEVTSNPVWYAVQALPYLMEYPYECAEQTFSRYYANTIASFLANSNPKIQEVFNAWKSSDALLSNLEKNQELKSLIIQETPWLRDAQSETEQKKRIALLFDLNKMKNEQEKAINKLKGIQKNSGGFPWFKGGRYESDFITQHIATGFGHLDKLGIKNTNDETENMIKNAVSYLDNKLVSRYNYLLESAEKRKQYFKNKEDGEKAYRDFLAQNNLSYFTIQYLYMRSFYKDLKINRKTQTAFDYYQNQSIKYWDSYNLYAKGQIALSLFRNDEKPTATKILNSLKENSITSEELGMYWKENTAGYYYYQAPVETQALLIETFAEIENDTETIDNLKIWLLKNKQTNRWKTTKSTTEAVYALLLNGSDWISVEETVTVKVGDKNINPAKMKNVKVEAGTGYFKTSWKREEITPEMGEVTISKKENGIAWGGLYWQYFEDLDKITSAETPLKLKKKLFLKVNSDTGKELNEINEKSTLKLGDLITVRIELRADRDMEFIHMKDMRASGVEPINVLSQYKYQDGLSYYESTKDAATNFFFDRLPKGVYVFEYDVRVNNIGNFSNGITTIQSMYAPEFSSHSKGERILIE